MSLQRLTDGIEHMHGVGVEGRVELQRVVQEAEEQHLQPQPQQQ
jgi:hypothetical protein